MGAVEGNADYVVKDPAEFNEAWARAFNSRDIVNIMQFYEQDALLAMGSDVARGKASITQALTELMGIPGTLEGKNNFYLVHGDLALLRADWRLFDPNGQVMMSGSSAEIIRRQPDGRWLYVIDHASGSSEHSSLT